MRRLVLATGIATFVLIVVGGVVRVSDSGLGCGPAGSGFHGWPFCNGDVVPGVNLHSIVEYTHRAVAGIVTILIIAIVVQAWRRQREYLMPALGLLGLVLAQAALGGATVEDNLEEAYVAAHLCLAMLLLGGLIWLYRAVSAAGNPDRAVRDLADLLNRMRRAFTSDDPRIRSATASKSAGRRPE